MVIIPHTHPGSHILVSPQPLEEKASNIAGGVVAHTRHFCGEDALKHWFTDDAIVSSERINSLWDDTLKMVVDDEGNGMDEAVNELEWHKQDPLANIDDIWEARRMEAPPLPTEPVVFGMALSEHLFDCGQTVNSSKTVADPPMEISCTNDDQVTSLQQQLAAMQAQLAAFKAIAPGPGAEDPGQGG